MIRFEQIRFAYVGRPPVLDGASVAIGPGLTLLLGPNGSGKSTLLRLAAGVERPHAGRVTIDGVDLWTEEVASRRALTYVPEQPDMSPYKTLGEILTLVERLRGAGSGWGRKALDEVGLGALAARSIRELSLGQRRRVALAAARIGSSRVVLLDDPLEAMDRAIADALLGWIDAWVDTGAAVVVAGHDLERFASRTVRAAAVRDGRIALVESLPVDPRERLAALEALARS